MKMAKKNVLLTAILATFTASAQNTNELQSLDQINLAYSGDETRLGVGITENGDFIGDFLKSFNTTYRSNWLAQAWYSDGAGGIELDYHWISTESEQNLIDNAQDYKVNKLFLALDQNTFDDRKLTIGGGRESEDLFWNIYGSKATTGRRLVSDVSVFTNDIIVGTLGTHVTNQSRTIEDITRIYEQPYDWGFGGRLGKYFDNNLVRLTGGLDYETGDFSSDQFTASIDVEKYFANTGHSIALHVESLSKDGNFVTDKSDTRAFLMYRYDFGKTFQPTERYQEVKVVDEVALARLKEERRTVIQNKIDLSSMAFFNLDSAILREDTKAMLADVVTQIKSLKLGSKINIVGHTCWLGTDQYNQSLSERRATAAQNFFIEHGIEINQIQSSGKGESEPAFDNNGPDIAKNRRVAISFLSLEEDFKQGIVAADEVPVKWVKQPIKTAPSWLARALRNPAKHKRTVDVYKFEEKESITTLGAVVELNSQPTALEDNISVLRNSTGILIDVLNNDSDPENDTLTISDVIQPANGTVVNNGTSLTYTPNNGFIGADTLEYTIDDGHGDQAQAQVTITVENNAPVATDDSVIATGTDPLIINVTNNDSDSDGSILTIVSVTQGQNGSVNINSDGTVTYQANLGFMGTDSFTYTIEDEDGAQSTATVTVIVEEPANSAPTAVDDLYLVMMNGVYDFNPLENDSDIDGDTISILSVDTSLLRGTLTFSEDGTMQYSAPFLFSGNDSFTYTITDNNGNTATATVIMCVSD
jgi:outer membrane protein OmpA-like peptidoglycan-associated protein